MIYRHIFIVRSVLMTIRQEIGRARWTETGGPLVGYISEDEALVVTHAGGPGPKSVLTHSSVLIDGEYAQGFCTKVNREWSGRIDYVGDWHRHPGWSIYPSDRDIEAMKIMATFSDCPIKHPISLIYRRLPEKWATYVYSLPDSLDEHPSSLIQNIPS